MILGAQPDLFFRLAHDGTVLEHRPATACRPSRGAVTVVGTRWQDVIPADVAAAIDSALGRLAAGSALETIEYAHAMPDRVRRFEARLVELPSGRSSPWCAIVPSVTTPRRCWSARRRSSG